MVTTTTAPRKSSSSSSVRTATTAAEPDHQPAQEERSVGEGAIESEWATFSWKRDESGGLRWSFSSKLIPDLGVRDATLASFKGRRSGMPWKTSLDAVSARVAKDAEVEGLPSSLIHLGDGFQTVVMTEEVVDMGHVHVDFALADKGPFLLMRLRCPAVKHSDGFRMEEFVLFEGDAEVSGDRPLKRPGRTWLQVYEPHLLLVVLVVLGAGAVMWEDPSSSPRVMRLAAAALLMLVVLMVRPVLLNYLKNRDHRALFVNGWNAWSFTGTVLHGDTVPQPGMPHAFSRAFHHGAGCAEFRCGCKDLTTEMFGLLADRKKETGILFGFLSQQQQFGAFSFDPEMRDVGAHCRCDGQLILSGASIVSDWCILQLMPVLPEDPLAEFMDMAAQYNHSMVHGNRMRTETTAEDIPVGWCSWYHFYEKISESNLAANIQMMASLRDQLPLQLFQIDDGYQAAWGDWTVLDKTKFPTRTMKHMVEEIRRHHLRPGLWLAPLAADKHSKLAAEHPKWIIRRPGSDYYAANSANCGKWFYGLDVTNPEVQQFVKETLTIVSHGHWSFDYLKLDFLYAAALKGERMDPTINTAQALQLAMRLIRGAVGMSVFILGCGAPLGATIGWVNANRVSADAGPSWLPSFPLPDCKWNLPCGRNMVRNTINRLTMHGRWWINDPDCMLLREATSFTPDEIIGIATVKALSGGSLILSDNLGSVSRRRLQIAQCLLPVVGKAAVAMDLLEREMPEILRLSLHTTALGAWVMVALCNWTERVKDTTSSIEPLIRPLLLPPSPPPPSSSFSLHVFDFWNTEYHHMEGIRMEDRAEEVLRARRVGIHSAKLYAIRIHDPTSPQYLGSDIHFSCGTEVTSFQWTGQRGGNVRAVWTIDAGKTMSDGSYHHAWLSLPGAEFLKVKISARKDEREEEREGEGVKVGGCVWKVCVVRGGVRRVEVAVEYEWSMGW